MPTSAAQKPRQHIDADQRAARRRRRESAATRGAVADAHRRAGRRACGRAAARRRRRRRTTNQHDRRHPERAAGHEPAQRGEAKPSGVPLRVDQRGALQDAVHRQRHDDRRAGRARRCRAPLTSADAPAPSDQHQRQRPEQPPRPSPGRCRRTRMPQRPIVQGTDRSRPPVRITAPWPERQDGQEGAPARSASCSRPVGQRVAVDELR